MKNFVKNAARHNRVLSFVLERANFYRKLEMAPFMKRRRALARQFVRGEGLEIGALHMRLGLPRGAKVRYVDRFDEREARRHFPELKMNRLAKVDIVDDGEVLSSIPASSVDFIIACHMIEHCENPFGAIQNWISKLRPGGVIFLAVPDRRFTFDRDRPATTFEHLMIDYRNSQISRATHYEEWARHVSKLPEPEIADAVACGLQERQNIHFHVWTSNEFLAMMQRCQQELNWPIAVVGFLDSCGDFSIVLKKTATDSVPDNR